MKNIYVKILATLLFLGSTQIHAMEQEFIKIQELPQGHNVLASDGARIENNVEYLDIKNDESLSFESFEELIQKRAKYGLPYVIAIVSYKQPESEFIRHNYYDATTLNAYIFGPIEKKGMKYKYTNTEDKKRQIDPLTRNPIESITYVGINPDRSTKVVEKSEFLLYGNQLQKQNFARHFYLNSLFNRNLIDPSKKLPGVSVTFDQIVEKLKEIYRNI